VKNLSGDCEDLVKKGLAKSFTGEVIQFTGSVDQSKMAKFEHSYAVAFHKRWVDRTAKEREAEKKYHDFVITY